MHENGALKHRLTMPRPASNMKRPQKATLSEESKPDHASTTQATINNTDAVAKGQKCRKIKDCPPCNAQRCMDQAKIRANRPKLYGKQICMSMHKKKSCQCHVQAPWMTSYSSCDNAIAARASKTDMQTAAVQTSRNAKHSLPAQSNMRQRMLDHRLCSACHQRIGWRQTSPGPK